MEPLKLIIRLTQVIAVYIFCTVASPRLQAKFGMDNSILEKAATAIHNQTQVASKPMESANIADICEDLNSDNECMLRAKSILDYKKLAQSLLTANIHFRLWLIADIAR
jgi:hypothetical protein